MVEGELEEKSNLEVVITSPPPSKAQIHDFIEKNERQIIDCILKRNHPKTIARKLNVSGEFASRVLAEYFKVRGLIAPSQNKKIRERFAVMSALELDEAKREVYKIMKKSEDDHIKLKAAASLTKMIGDELNFLKELGILTVSTPKEREGVDISRSLEKIRKDLEKNIDLELNPEEGL